LSLPSPTVFRTPPVRKHDIPELSAEGSTLGALLYWPLRATRNGAADAGTKTDYALPVMKSFQQKKRKSPTHGMLTTGIAAVALASLGLTDDILAQQPPAPPPAPSEKPALPPAPLRGPDAQRAVPPPPPDGAAERTSIRGTISQYLMNPDGLVDGVLLSDNTIVRFPPHLGQQLIQTVKPQDLVQIDGFLESQGSIHAATITNANTQQTVIDTPPSPQNLPPGPISNPRQSMSVSGVIKVLMHSPRGEIVGAVLDSGAIVHVAPSVGTQQAPLFQVGAPLAASGYGTINSYGRSMEASVIGPSPSRD
jgi:hypothetical protein